MQLQFLLHSTRKSYRIFNTWLGDPMRLVVLETVLEQIRELDLLHVATVTGSKMLAGLKDIQVCGWGRTGRGWGRVWAGLDVGRAGRGWGRAEPVPLDHSALSSPPACMHASLSLHRCWYKTYCMQGVYAPVTLHTCHPSHLYCSILQLSPSPLNSLHL